MSQVSSSSLGDLAKKARRQDLPLLSLGTCFSAVAIPLPSPSQSGPSDIHAHFEPPLAPALAWTQHQSFPAGQRTCLVTVDVLVDLQGVSVPDHPTDPILMLTCCPTSWLLVGEVPAPIDYVIVLAPSPSKS